MQHCKIVLKNSSSSIWIWRQRLPRTVGDFTPNYTASPPRIPHFCHSLPPEPQIPCPSHDIADPSHKKKNTYAYFMLGFVNKRQADERHSELKQHSELHLILYCSFPGIKRPRREADKSAPSTAAVGKEWSHTVTLPYVFSACTETTSHRDCR